MKILIYGCGVLGSVAAARLAQGGQAVTVLARGKRLEDIRRDGIVLERFADGARTHTRIPVTDKLGPDDAYDLVLVMMGMHQAPAVLPALAANRHAPNVLFVGNSVSGGGLTAALGSRVLRGFLLVAGTTLPGGAVRYASRERSRPGWIVGEPDGSTSPRIREIAAALDTSGIGVEICPAVDAWLKTHAAMISALGAAVYAAGGTPAQLAADPAAAKLAVGALKESLSALQGLGIPILPKGALLYLWIPAPILAFLLRRMLRSEEVAFGFAHADKARVEIRMILDEMLALYRRGGRPLPALDELNKWFR